jgi:hypothetical protein
MYDTAEKANAAVSKLKNWGLTSDLISVISVAATGTGDALNSALMAANIVRDNAKVYAQSAGAASTFVVVRAPFGVGCITIDILDSCHPTSIADPTEDSDGPTWDDAAPLSSALHLPVIAAWRPFGGIPAVSKSSRTTCAALGWPELSATGAPTTEGMMALLSTSPTPFSSLLNLPLLR